MELTRGFYYIQSIATWYQNRRIKISHIVSKILGDNTDESGAINCIKSYVLFCQADLGALLSWLQKKSLHANSSFSQASSEIHLTLKDVRGLG